MAKVAAELSRSSHNSGRAPERVARHHIRYLYSTRLRRRRRGLSVQFECFSDAASADELDDRKSSQGYLMRLFGLPIHWEGREARCGDDRIERWRATGALVSREGTQRVIARLFGGIELDLTKSLQLPV